MRPSGGSSQDFGLRERGAVVYLNVYDLLQQVRGPHALHSRGLDTAAVAAGGWVGERAAVLTLAVCTPWPVLPAAERLDLLVRRGGVPQRGRGVWHRVCLWR